VVLLDVDPTTGLGRVRSRGVEEDRIEAQPTAFHERVRYAFLDLASAEPQRYLVLDASLDGDELAERVRGTVAELLASRNISVKSRVTNPVGD
ncbi:MAG: dTMP kinase, partial [Longispora sp.]|nr:dTMP kinase [Longispora sp. (in: high G+C Gram-positive bacteria)]